MTTPEPTYPRWCEGCGSPLPHAYADEVHRCDYVYASLAKKANTSPAGGSGN